MHKILLLEDDAELRLELAESLEMDAFDVRHHGTVHQFWSEFGTFQPDAVVLDMMLPDGGGLSVAKDIRAEHDIGIIFLSGRRDETDRIVALEIGADDFIVKPCSPRELIARLTAVLRRCTPQVAEQPMITVDDRVSFCGFQLDLAAMELFDPDNRRRSLTTAEFDLLKTFVQSPQRVLSRDQLIDSIRGEDWAGYDRTVDGLISRLRKKLKHEEVDTQILRTVHGAGYIFTPDVR